MERAKIRRQRGFTLVEVLVALAIVAVAMAAASRAAAMMTHGNTLLRDKSVALLAARSQLAELSLRGASPGSRQVIECNQGNLRLQCEQSVRRQGELLQVSLRVYDRERDGPPLASLDTLLPGAQQ